MRALVRFLVGAARWVGITLFAVLTVCLFWSVVIRYFAIFGGSLPWVEEFARFTFIWMSFLGAIVALDRSQHITIDLVAKALPRPFQARLAHAVDAATLVFLAIYTVKGADLVRLTTDQFSPQLNVPMSVIHAAIPVSGAVMIFQVLCHFSDRVREQGAGPTLFRAE
jgi:TRAP-type transport system small permease protein